MINKLGRSTIYIFQDRIKCFMEIGDEVKSKTRENVNIFSSNQTQFDLKEQYLSSLERLTLENLYS